MLSSELKERIHYLFPCPDPSGGMMNPEAAAKAFSSDNAIKDAWAQAAATRGPTVVARKAT